MDRAPLLKSLERLRFPGVAIADFPCLPKRFSVILAEPNSQPLSMACELNQLFNNDIVRPSLLRFTRPDSVASALLPALCRHPAGNFRMADITISPFEN